MTTEQQNQTAQPEFGIQRIYIKDISFEAPQGTEIFQKEWKPELNLQLNINTNNLGGDQHEVILQVTVTAKSADDKKTIFLAEVKQAGVFILQAFPPEQIKPMLGIVCPNILFPYAREMVSDLVARATFPPLYLSPVNFEALYAQQMQQAEGSESGSDSKGTIITH